MKKIIIHAFISLILMESLHSCMFSGCEKVPFNKDDLSWITGLPNEGDTILYKGTDETIDTFSVTLRRHEYSKCNRFEVSKYQPEEFTLIMVNNNHKTYGSWLRHCQFDITKKLKNNQIESAFKKLKFYDLNTYGFDDLSKIKTEQIHLKYNNKSLETYCFDHSVTRMSSASFKERIISFNWSKELGLVRYMDADSVVYEYWKRY